ncbi:hypothetical protein G8A07_14250 [Roseateles sp. DAIF2]|uniref:hypothetical protein n=1 Tax=Roseateles sp. DAIF2 TaxID=2714952 RepID=UPI0018A2D3D0|nr:hypothetical protein [Roseateles sp. DAIF2]QPF73966.1 hypothetical protein G8A07_14250 [Roseateles sp. DAIF2]
MDSSNDLLNNSAFFMGLAGALTLAWVTWQARRLGNDRRDVVLLGTSAALSGLGAGIAALV